MALSLVALQWTELSVGILIALALAAMFWIPYLLKEIRDGAPDPILNSLENDPDRTSPQGAPAAMLRGATHSVAASKVVRYTAVFRYRSGVICRGGSVAGPITMRGVHRERALIGTVGLAEVP